jgi:hypothetical protein
MSSVRDYEVVELKVEVQNIFAGKTMLFGENATKSERVWQAQTTKEHLQYLSLT